MSRIAKIIVVIAFTLTPPKVAECQFPEGLARGRLFGLKDLPFCAIVFDEDFKNTETTAANELAVRILMDQDDVSESNLRQLFALVSKRYPSPQDLYAYVETDARSVADVVNQERYNIGKRPGQSGKSSSRGPGGAFYRRSAKVELFRYNPDYPAWGMKTVILRGTE